MHKIKRLNESCAFAPRTRYPRTSCVPPRIHRVLKHNTKPLATLADQQQLENDHQQFLERCELAVHSSTPNRTETILHSLESIPLQTLMSTAAAIRDNHRPRRREITFSPKVFIPLTQLCRDSCGYCTFARGPSPGRRIYMTLSEVLEVARLGKEQGCTEALFTLGDKPELRYPEAAQELAEMGLKSTLEYVAVAAEMVLQQTGLLPHINAGVMNNDDLKKLKTVSVSQGLMLESTSLDLLQPDKAHYDCPDKDPSLRLATLEAAGQENIPMTTGILIGIGETKRDRIEALLAIRDCHSRYGHVQEIIVQNFRAKKGTLMENYPETSLDDLLWTIAAARIIFGPEMNIQAPPNLTPENDDVTTLNSNPTTLQQQHESQLESGWKALLDAGINDWGGVSPITRDFVNPEKSWPHLTKLAAVTARAGFVLTPRLPIYSSYLIEDMVADKSKWMDKVPFAAALNHSDSLGLARASTWFAGMVETQQQQVTGESSEESNNNSVESTTNSSNKQRASPKSRVRTSKLWRVSSGVDGILDDCPRPEGLNWVEDLMTAVLNEEYELTIEDIDALFSVRGHDFDVVCKAADSLRQKMNGDTVTFVVNRNINYTNISKDLHPRIYAASPYLLPLSEIQNRVTEAYNRGATEVCMQGGIHPDFTGDTYFNILHSVKSAVPDMHVHAFSPLEVAQGASTLGWSVEKYLTKLKDVGLGSLPGTAAEVLDDVVRKQLCADKVTTAEWLDIIGTAHSVGLKTTSTIMFGHIDTPISWAKHLVALRSLQKQTGGFTEFVPLPFVHMQAPIFRVGRSRAGPTLKECILMHAIARLALHPWIYNIQASWVKMGPEKAAALLSSGCNDMGGSLMNESITRAAGAAHGQELVPEEMKKLIVAAGRVPRQRTTLYELI